MNDEISETEKDLIDNANVKDLQIEKIITYTLMLGGKIRQKFLKMYNCNKSYWRGQNYQGKISCQRL